MANATLFWPGYFQPDSSGQYASALSGMYSDHHPPVDVFCVALFGDGGSGAWPYVFVASVLVTFKLFLYSTDL